MTERRIRVGQDFMVDGVDPVHDGTGMPWYAIQMVDRANQSKKYCQVVCEPFVGKLTPVLRIDSIIGAPSIVIRPDGSAYVCGGGKDNTIVTGVSIPNFTPLTTTARLLALVALLEKRIEALEGSHG